MYSIDVHYTAILACLAFEVFAFKKLNGLFLFFTPEVFAVSKNHFPWSNLFPLYLNPSSHTENTMIIQGLLFVLFFFYLCFFFFFKYINKLCSRTLSFHESMISFSQLSCPCPQCSISQGLEGLVCSALYHR